MKTSIPKLAKDLAALVGIARKETDPEKIEAALTDARGQVDTAIAERAAAEAAYRDSLLDATPAESERHLSEASAAKVKVDRAEALVAALAQRLTLAREEQDRAGRKAIHDDAAAKCAAIRDRLPEEYRHHAMALRTLLRDLAEAEVARDRAKDHFEEFGDIESPEYRPRGRGYQPEEIVERTPVDLWVIDGRVEPVSAEKQKDVRPDGRRNKGYLGSPGGGDPWRCTLRRFERVRFREAVTEPYTVRSLLAQVHLPAFHITGEDFCTPEHTRGPLTALAHLSREVREKAEIERPVRERFELLSNPPEPEDKVQNVVRLQGAA